MNLNFRQAVLPILYAAGLLWLLLYEIVPRWSYMLYAGEFSWGALAAALGFSAILGLSVPSSDDVKAMIVSSLNYIFFVPSVVYAFFSNFEYSYVFYFLILYLSVYFFSCGWFGAFVIFSADQKNILIFVVLAVLIVVSAQAALGGMSHFDLNVGRVYEFRGMSANDSPSIFGCLFYNAANVLIPIGIIFSFKYKKHFTSCLLFVMAMILFGMNYQKSVLFIQCLIFCLYLFFSMPRASSIIGLAFLAVPAVSIVEVVYLRDILQSSGVAYFTSYTVRRVLFTPAMFDMIFVEYFSGHERYYWSSSRLGAWALGNPYTMTAPHQIGKVYFSNSDVSADTGVIGNSFAHAEIWGVLLYTLIVGVVISVLNSFGEKIEHNLVASVSFITVFFIVTTTDFLASILSHGLLILFLILSFFSGTIQNKHAGGVVSI